MSHRWFIFETNVTSYSFLQTRNSSCWPLTTRKHASRRSLEEAIKFLKYLLFRKVLPSELIEVNLREWAIDAFDNCSLHAISRDVSFMLQSERERQAILRIIHKKREWLLKPFLPNSIDIGELPTLTTKRWLAHLLAPFVKCHLSNWRIANAMRIMFPSSKLSKRAKWGFRLCS